MGIRVDLRLNPRVDARGRVNLRNSGSQTRQSHRRPVVPELANTLQGQDHYPAPGLADRSVPGRTTACGLRSRLGDGAPDPSPVHRHGSARKRNVGTPGGRDVQLLAIPDATPVTVWAVSRNAAGMLTRTVLPCVPGPRYRS